MAAQLRTVGFGLFVATIGALLSGSIANGEDFRLGLSSGRNGGHTGERFVGVSPVQPVRPLTPRVRPILPPAMPVVPRMGFMGHMEAGWGMVVDSVNPGSVAHRIGLERGDVITRINHTEINSDRGYSRALRDAVQFEGGQLALKILDVRSGRIVARTGNLFSGSGPVMPRSTVHNHRSHENERMPFRPQAFSKAVTTPRSFDTNPVSESY